MRFGTDNELWYNAQYWSAVPPTPVVLNPTLSLNDVYGTNRSAKYDTYDTVPFRRLRYCSEECIIDNVLNQRCPCFDFEFNQTWNFARDLFTAGFIPANFDTTALNAAFGHPDGRNLDCPPVQSGFNIDRNNVPSGNNWNGARIGYVILRSDSFCGNPMPSINSSADAAIGLGLRGRDQVSALTDRVGAGYTQLYAFPATGGAPPKAHNGVLLVMSLGQDFSQTWVPCGTPNPALVPDGIFDSSCTGLASFETCAVTCPLGYSGGGVATCFNGTWNDPRWPLPKCSWETRIAEIGFHGMTEARGQGNFRNRFSNGVGACWAKSCGTLPTTTPPFFPVEQKMSADEVALVYGSLTADTRNDPISSLMAQLDFGDARRIRMTIKKPLQRVVTETNFTEYWSVWSGKVGIQQVQLADDPYKFARVEFGRTNLFDFLPNIGWTQVNFTNIFNVPPVVIASLMHQPVNRFAVVRTRNITPTGFEVAIQTETNITYPITWDMHTWGTFSTRNNSFCAFGRTDSSLWALTSYRGGAGFCSDPNRLGVDWMDYNLLNNYTITMLGTRGAASVSDPLIPVRYVTAFTIQIYIGSTLVWTANITGNSDSDTINFYTLPTPVRGDRVRFIPLSFVSQPIFRSAVWVDIVASIPSRRTWTVGWFAAEPGCYYMEGGRALAVVQSSQNEGIKTVNYGGQCGNWFFVQTPRMVGHIMSFNDPDPAWLRYFAGINTGSPWPSTTQLTTYIQEETPGAVHDTETTGYLVWEVRQYGTTLHYTQDILGVNQPLQFLAYHTAWSQGVRFKFDVDWVDQFKFRVTNLAGRNASARAVWPWVPVNKTNNNCGFLLASTWARCYNRAGQSGYDWTNKLPPWISVVSQGSNCLPPDNNGTWYLNIDSPVPLVGSVIYLTLYWYDYNVFLNSSRPADPDAWLMETEVIFPNPEATTVTVPSGATTGGDTIVASGYYWPPDARLWIGDTPCAQNTYQRISQKIQNVACITPPGVGANYPLRVVTSRGNLSFAAQFSYAPPVIQLASPASIPTAGGVLSLAGSNFGGFNFATATVTVAGRAAAPCQVTFVSADHRNLQCQVPAGQDNGTVVVCVGGGIAVTQCTAAWFFVYTAPTLASVSPQGAATVGGVNITIAGSNLGLSPAVTVGGRPCSVQTSSHTSIVCVLPEGQGLGNTVTVTVGSRAASLTGAVGYSYGPPTFNTISPSNGPTVGGYNLTINGASLGLFGATVTLGSPGDSQSCMVLTQTHNSIVCQVAPDAGAARRVNVVVAGQTLAELVTFNFDAPTLTRAFSAPQQGLTAGGGDLTIVGTNFGPSGTTGVTVQVSTVSCLVKSQNQTAILCTLPEGDGNNNTVTVSVKGQASLNTVSYSYDIPVITQVFASQWNTDGSSVVTITGRNFGRVVTAISVLVQPGAILCVISPTNPLARTHTSIICTIGAGQGINLSVNVTVGALSGVSSAIYSYNSPTLTSVSPSNGPTIGNTLITLIGTQFGPSPAVTIGGAACSIQFRSATVIQCLTPAGQGASSSLVATFSGQSASSTFRFDAPIISGINPPNGPTDGNVNITLTGSNLGLGNSYSLVLRDAVFNRNFTVTSISGNHTRVNFVLPAGTGGGLVPILLVASQGPATLANAITFSYNIPVVTLVTGCVASGSSTVDCLTNGTVTFVLTGSNFGTLSAQAAVQIGGVTCSISALSNTQITCSVAARPTGGFSLPIRVNVSGQVNDFAAVNAVTVSYRGPTVLSWTPDPQVFTTTLGGETFTFLGRYLQTVNSSTLLVKFGHPGDMRYTCANPVISTVYNDTIQAVTCTTPAAVGVNLAVQVTVNGPQVSRESTPRISFPTPVFVDNTIRSDKVIYKFQPALSGTATSNQPVFLDVKNVGTDESLIDVYYGDVTNPTKYKCVTVTLYSLWSNETRTIECRTASLVDDVSGPFYFTLSVYGVNSSLSNDAYNYPQLPLIKRVSGCSDSTTIVNGTAECPTAGGIPITITGDFFTDTSVARIGGAICGNAVISTTTFICTLPAGAGFRTVVEISNIGNETVLYSRPSFSLSYAAPLITKISGDAPCVQNGQWPENCPRAGMVLLTIEGTNFGASSSVIIGAASCTLVNASHSLVYCTLPQGTGDNEVYLIQDNGVLSRNSGKLAYFRCPLGQFAPRGQVLCNPCAAGTFASTTGQTVCIDCAPGFYAATQGLSFCRECETGRFQNAFARTNCTLCPVGKYTDALGQFFCKDCETGRFQNMSEATFCYNCAPGEIQPAVGQVGCSICDAGKFSPTDRSVGCTDCDAGSVAAFPGSSRCDLCPAGTVAARVGSSECTNCSAGTFSATAGLSLCRSCPGGTYSPTPRSTRCFTCEAGFYSQLSSGSARCEPCAAGYFQSAPGQAACAFCPAGSYSEYNAVNGTTSCIPCDQGSYAAFSPSASCSLCEPGFYSDAKGQSLCKPCVAGTATNDKGTVRCAPCAPGSANPDPAQKTCPVCNEGYYQDATGAASCKPCLPGQASNATGLPACYTCPPGKRSNAPSASTQCVDCEPGTYNNAPGVHVCFTCPTGSYTPTPGYLNCLLCPDGQFNLESGSGVCNNCSAGSSRRGSALECSLCPVGSYQDQPGQGDCFLCPAGSFSDLAGSKTCTPCSTGRFTAGAGNSVCSACQAGRYAPARSLTACLDCEPGRAQEIIGQAQCALCESGSYTDSFGRRTCILCDNGFSTNETGAERCSPCQPGYYAPRVGSMECLPCDPGSSNAAVGQPACFSCAKGSVTNETAQTTCQLCEPGFIANSPGLTECEACTPGYFSPAAGLAQCTICPPGSATAEEHASVCPLCAAGFFSASSGSLSCTPCGAGTFAEPGNNTCTLCPAGSFANSSEAGQCDLCGPGFYQDEIKSTGCKPCVAGSASSALGATMPCDVCPDGKVAQTEGRQVCADCGPNSASDPLRRKCLCAPGFFDFPVAGKTVNCLPCPDGGDCRSEGAELSNLKSLSGWWRASNDTLTFYRCLRERECPGGVAADSACAGSATGPLCAICPPGYIKDPTTICRVCPSKANSIAYFVLIVVACAILLWIQLYVILRSGSDLWKKQAQLRAEFQNKALPRVPYIYRTEEVELTIAGAPPPPPNWTYKLKILLSFLQIVTSFGSNIEIVWPPSFKNFLSYFFPLQLDIVSMSSFDCLYNTNFFSRFLLWTIIPTIIGIILVIGFVFPKYIRAYLLGRNFISDESQMVQMKKKKARQKAWKILIFLLFLIYPTVSSTITKLYICQNVAGKSYLRADMRQECFTALWNRYSYWGAVAIIIYPIGIPLFFYAMIRKYRKRLFEPGVQAQLGFLYAGYHRDVWWFEAVDMIHKLFLTSLLGFFPIEGQIPVGMAVVIIYAMIICYFKPYLRKGDDRLHLLGQVELYLFLLAGYMFRNAITLNQTDDIVLSIILILMLVLFVGYFVQQAALIIYKKYLLWKEGKSIKEEDDDYEPPQELQSRPSQGSQAGTEDNLPVAQVVSAGAGEPAAFGEPDAT